MTPSPRRLLEALFREIARDIPSRPRLDLIAREIVNAEPRLRWVVRMALLNGYLRAARETARQAIREGAVMPVGTPPRPIQPPSPPETRGASPGQPAPYRFPGVEAAADWLHRRQLLTRDDFARLDAQAQAAAFTIARVKTVDAVKTVRDAVGSVVRDGGTLPEFRDAVKGAVKDVFSPAQVETLYRSHVGLAQAAGQRAVIEHPAVGDEFPYRMWSATHDSRVRPEHLAMETHGQNGTAVYRADDPMWNTLWPPCHYNCRCLVVPLSIEDAARHGSREAARWLATGTPPTNPVWAKTPYPVTPPEGWPVHTGIVAVV